MHLLRYVLERAPVQNRPSTACNRDNAKGSAVAMQRFSVQTSLVGDKPTDSSNGRDVTLFRWQCVAALIPSVPRYAGTGYAYWVTVIVAALLVAAHADGCSPLPRRPGPSVWLVKPPRTIAPPDRQISLSAPVRRASR
jgi:hypothetical protein